MHNMYYNGNAIERCEIVSGVKPRLLGGSIRFCWVEVFVEVQINLWSDLTDSDRNLMEIDHNEKKWGWKLTEAMDSKLRKHGRPASFLPISQ